MRSFPPNIDPKIQTLIATLIGVALVDDFNAIEQLAIGNGLIQIGQTMVTHANFQWVIEERIIGNIININSRQFKSGGSPYTNPKYDSRRKVFYKNIYTHVEFDEQLDLLKQAIERIVEEIEKIKKDML